MESTDTSLPDINTKGRFLQRSCSMQPDVATCSNSSPYSSRRKSKYPGRSLTEIYTGKARISRSSSSDRSQSLRQRTFTAGSPIVRRSQLSDEGKLFLNKSFSGSPSSSIDQNCPSIGSSNNENEDLMEIDPLPEASELKQELKAISFDSYRTEKQIVDMKTSYIWHIFKGIFRIFFWIVAFLLIVALLVLSISAYYKYEKTQCDLKRNEKIPFEELNNQLRQLVIGQEIAVNVVLNSLRNFQINKLDSLLVMWLVGWSGSGKTYTTNILKNVLSSVSKVFTIIPSLYPEKDRTLLEAELKVLYNQLDECSYNVILIDGWDESNQPLWILQQLVTYLNPKVNKKKSKGKTIIAFSGTQHSQFINKKYLDMRLDGKRREQFSVEDFNGVIEGVVNIKEMNDKLKYFVLVPFMPMEEEQVRQCVREEISRSDIQNKSKDYDLSEIIAQVTKQLHFIPPNNPLIASTGCKRVQALLRLSLHKIFEDAS